uniref:PIH1D1/2/3 CS-like domain-containing protein n=1 Tax=Salarias fasciatus TaxID=181472 RepID=A0A672FVB4_SALFA
MATCNKPQLWQQAGQVWSVLDDLSVNDPAAYRTLMEKQMKEGAEFLAAPELHAGLSAAVLEPKKFMLYINVCCWKRVPAPPDPSSCIKKDLIQVISSSSAEPQKPEYQLEVKMDPAGVPRSVELVVELPKVRSVSECQLSVSEDDVLLDVEDVYHLLLEFPKTVNEDTASAIFNKKKRQLLLKVDILVNEKHLIGTDQK